MNNTGITKTFNILIIAVFITLLWLPNIDSLFNIAPQWTNTEQRALSKLPDFKWDWRSITDFHNKFVKYFIDNFGFRSLLIHWNSLFKLNYLKTDQFPKVLVGRQDWLYLIKDDEGNNAIDFYRAIKPFAGDKEIERWAQPLVDLNAYFKRKGIRFLLIFAPMKTRIYPEFIPSYLKPVRSSTRLDQIKEYLKKNTEIASIDLGDAVLEGKKHHRVYFKYDVHWNGYGAFYGYQKIAEELKRIYPRLNPRGLGDYRVETETCQGGDLAAMLGLKEQFSEKFYTFSPLFPQRAVKVADVYQIKSSRSTEIFKTANPSLPKAVVYHDSFFNFVMPFLSELFNRMACFLSYNRVDVSIVEREKPDIVLYEMAEHFVEKSPAYVTPLNLR